VARYRLRAPDAERGRSDVALQARPLTLVLDASTVVVAALADDGFALFGDEALVAPPLMWSQARSALHELMWRREISPEEAEAARARVERSPCSRRSPARLGDQAWRLATTFGWAKTYDAEYVALAGLLHCRLITVDARLRRATERLGFVIGPTDV